MIFSVFGWQIGCQRRVRLQPLQQPGEIDWNNSTLGRAKNPDLVNNRLRSKGCRRSDQYQLAGAPKRPGADALPVVTRGKAGAIQKNLEAGGLQSMGEGGGIGSPIAPGIGYEKIVAEKRSQADGARASGFQCRRRSQKKVALWPRYSCDAVPETTGLMSKRSDTV